MPDVFDPYEERGVPNPHEPDFGILDEIPWVAANSGSSNIPAMSMTQKEIADERRRLRAVEARRIRPGFYPGVEPLDTAD